MAAGALRSLWWWRPPCLLRRVTVNFVHTDNEAMQGVLWATRGPWVTLRDVTAMKAGQPPVPIPGEIVMHRDRVAFFQVEP